MLRRVPFHVPDIILATVTLLLFGACGKDNPMRPLVVSSVTARVDPAAYLGPCPGTFNFSADIASPAGTVTYRWERSDGVAGPTETITFSEAGTRTVTDNWQPDAVGSFWGRVHILTPKDLYSNQAAFTNGCGAITITAFAHVTPTTYVSNCPGTFDLSGEVTTNGALTVTYRWERSDGVLGPTQTLNFSGAGTQTVARSWQLAAIGSFSGWIHLLTPIDRTSNEATFMNRCGSVTSATASVSPSSYSGDCPGTFDVSADLTAPAGTITYRWERSDGTAGSTEALTFNGAGMLSVTDTWPLSAIGSHWQRVHVLTPNDLYSNQATFTNDCGAAGPFAVRAVAASVSPSSGCVTAFIFSADISANGGGGIGTVTYRWEGSDGGIGPTETLNFSGSGTQKVSSAPIYEYADGDYWQRVHVLTPNDFYSNQVAFSVGCCFVCPE